MRFEITVQSTPAERYDGTIANTVRRLFATAEVPIAYEEGGSTIEEADNHFGFDTDPAQAAAVTFAVALATGKWVRLVDRDAEDVVLAAEDVLRDAARGQGGQS
jgi:hypothetical protein